jgi:excisionase family DNA binding protein
MQPTWFNVVECAKYLGVSKETIYRLLDKKKIPSHRLGKLWKFNRTELDKWMLRKK